MAKEKAALAVRTVDIRPGVSVLAVLRHLNYKPWFALGEFVDNSVQSFLQHKQELARLEGSGFKLRVDIDIDGTSPARISRRIFALYRTITFPVFLSRYCRFSIDAIKTLQRSRFDTRLHGESLIDLVLTPLPDKSLLLFSELAQQVDPRNYLP